VRCTARLSGVAMLVAAVVATGAGCGRVERIPTAVNPARSVSAHPEVSASPEDTTTPDDFYPTAEPTTPPFAAPTAAPESTTVACAGHPDAAQVIAALRRDRNLIAAGMTPRAVTGPLCAGSWQYTVLNVPDHEPLQVVTRGTGSSLTVVTAGTYVCTPEVTGAAPTGIVSAARCR
jgi:hypothetical protein